MIHRAITSHLIQQTGSKRAEAATGAVTLIQRFGSAANLNIHLHGLWLDGVYQTAGEASESEPVFHEAAPPTAAQLATLLDKIIKRILRLLTKAGHLIEEEGMVYLASTDPDNVLAPLQAAAATWRIAYVKNQPTRGSKSITSVSRPACGIHAHPRSAMRQRAWIQSARRRALRST